MTLFEEISKEIEKLNELDSLDDTLYEEYKKLKEIKTELEYSNLINSKTYSDIKDRMELIEPYYVEYKLFDEVEYTKKCRNKKVIPYNKFMEVCNKYGLISGTLNQYLGTIPLKNLKEYREYEDKYISKRDTFIVATPSEFDLSIPKTKIDPIIYERKSYDILDETHLYAIIITAWGEEEFLF